MLPAVEIYHLDTGIYIRLNCKVDLTAATELYMEIRKEDGTISEITAEIDPFNERYMRYLIPSAGSPFATAPSGKDFVDYWLRSRVVWSDMYPAGRQGKPVLLRVGKSWTAA